MLKHSSNNSTMLSKNLMNTSLGSTAAREIENDHRVMNDATLNASDKQELFRNSRSSSLPLKIMLNGGANARTKFDTSFQLNNTYNDQNSVDFDDVKIIKSWNGNSSLLINKCIDKLNTNNGGSNIYLTLQNNKLSLSEHFLNLIREESAVTTNNLPINVSKSRLITLNYNVNKNNESKNLNGKNSISTSPISSSKLMNNHTSIHQQKKHDLFQEKSKNSNSLKNISNKSNDLIENQDSNNNDLLGFFGGSETSEVNTETESLLSSSSTSSLKFDECHESLTKENDLENHLDAKHVVESDNSISSIVHPNDLVREESDEELKAFNYVDNNIISSNDLKSLSTICNENDETLTFQLSPTLQSAQENENRNEEEQANLNEEIGCEKIEEVEIKESPISEGITTTEEVANNEETSNIIDTSNLNASGSTGNSTSSSGIYSMSSNSSNSLTATETGETSTNDVKFEINSSLTILEDGSKSKITNDDTDNEEAQLSSSPLSSASTSLYEDEIEYRKFLPKKSCLSSKSKFYIDLTGTGNDLLQGDDCASANSANSNDAVTSSPLIPATPNNEIISSMSPSSSTLSFQQQNTSGSSSPTTCSKKKHVLFADSCGKELFTVRTMSEPSNCPPKLTSKIVQYFLNREFDGNKSPPGSVNGLSRTNSEEYNSFMPNGIVSSGGISSRNYDHYGISGFQYSNDSQLTGSIAFYSLNFSQPSSDYSKFRQRLNDNCVCLENVLLNSFKINGTIKVKNISYNKHVYVRCSFNNWASYEDYQTQYVSYDFYSSPNSSASGTSLYYGNHTSYQHEHKEFDTFRFEFQLPKTVNNNNSNSNAANGDGDATASIQFCICYRSGSGNDTREYWDSNDGKNYEILQYFIDIEKLKPTTSSSSSTNNNVNQNQLKSSNKTKPNYFKFDINNYVNKTNSSKYTNNNNSNFNGYNAQEIYY